MPNNNQPKKQTKWPSIWDNPVDLERWDRRIRSFVEAGDQYGNHQITCYLEAGLCEREIDKRILARIGYAPAPPASNDDALPDIGPESVSVTFARQAVFCGLPDHEIIAGLVELGESKLSAPNDPEEIVAILRAARREVDA
jgi:hypothetical protein